MNRLYRGEQRNPEYAQMFAFKPYPAIFLNVLKMFSAYYVCCIYSNAFQNTFTMAANTMNPDQTASKEFQFYFIWSNFLDKLKKSRIYQFQYSEAFFYGK